MPLINDLSTQTMLKVLLKQIMTEQELPEDMKETPVRMIRAWREMFIGYEYDPKAILKTFKHEKHDQMIVLHNIPFTSMCEHHFLPFFGHAHIGYVPKDKVVGASKLARLLEVFARRLQIQERICTSVVESLYKYLKPKGAACIIDAKHLCICARGISKDAEFTTSCVKGVFKTQAAARAEFLSFIKR